MPSEQNADKRRTIKPAWLLGSVIFTALGFWAWNTYQNHLNFQETDNAYLSTNVLQVSSRIAGVMTQLPIENNHPVQQGDLLFALDDQPYQLAIAESEAKLSQTTQQAAADDYRLEALAKLEQAKLNLKYTLVYAPISGSIANLSVRPGSYIQAGQALFALIDQQHWWVEANFKETQLINIHPGQSAKIHIDICPDSEFAGVVESIAGGTGAAFSLLPAQNANSNWVKVTQRIPVRIKLLPPQPECPLIIGSSAAVSVAIR